MRVFVLISLFYGCLISCQQIGAKNNSCHIISSYQKKKVSIGNWESEFKFWIGGGNKYKDSTYLFGLTENKIDIIKLTDILQQNNVDLQSTEIKFKSITTLALFVRAFENDSIVDRKNVVGASIYYVVGGQLKVSIFEKKGDDMMIIPTLTSNVDGIPILDFYKTSLIFRKLTKDTIDALVLSSDNFSNEEWKEIRNHSKGSLTKKLELYNSK